jgi:hypothetical protein
VVAQAVAILQEDQVPVFQLRGPGARLAREGMARGQGGEDLVVSHMGAVQAGHVEGQGDQGRVQVARLQGGDQPLGQVLAEIEPQARETGPQERQGAGQEEGRDGRDHAQAEPASEGLAGAAGGLDQFIGLIEDDLRLGEGRLAHIGQDQPGPRPVDHRRAQDLLQFLDAGGQGRLGDMSRLGGLSEAAVLDQELEVLQLPEGREHGIPTSTAGRAKSNESGAAPDREPRRLKVGGAWGPEGQRPAWRLSTAAVMRALKGW